VSGYRRPRAPKGRDSDHGMGMRERDDEIEGGGTLTGEFKCCGSSRAVCVESFWALDIEVKDSGCATWNFFVGWKGDGLLIAEMRLC
jgi:hypothetical protein